ncbi:MAG: adenylate/guanylate cyclase domain-containing protein [Pseudomonadota bacterium]
MTALPPESDRPGAGRKRRLRAALAADIANFSGRVSVSETRAFGHLSTILKVGREELDRHEGVLIGMPGDGLFALFESAVDAVHAALAMQQRLAIEPNLGGMRLRIGIHLGEVLFDGDLPFGETLNIAARLEGLADPGGILVSAAVVDAVSARIAATFEDRGVPQLKNIPRRIVTYSVKPAESLPPEAASEPVLEPLDHTMQFSRRIGTAPGAPAAGPVAAAPTPAPPPAMVATPTAPPQPSPPTSSPPSPVPVRAMPPVAPARTAVPPSPEQTAALTEMLAVHLGPVARVVVARKAKDAPTLGELVARLEAEVPAAERIAFRGRVQRMLGI